MSENKHILEIYRWPICIVSAILSVLLLLKIHPVPDTIASTDRWVKISADFAGGFCIWGILTTEGSLRLLLAIVFGATIAAASSGIAYLIFHAFAWDMNLFIWVPIITGLISIVWCYQALCKSSSIGERCPACSTRGTLSSFQSEKQFLGTVTKQNTGGTTGVYKTYNKYLVTTTHSCSSCGHAWDTTCETEEAA